MEKTVPVGPLPGDERIAVAVTLTTQLTDRKQIVVHTYLERDAELKVYHATLDKLGKAVDRQEAKYRLEALFITLEQHDKTLKQLESDFTRIDEEAKANWASRGKKGDPQLSNSEAAFKSNAKQNVLRYRVEINKLNADIEACKALIAKDD